MLALLFAVAPAVSAAQDTARRAPVPGRIRGRVVTDSGGAPIGGAEVRVPAASVSVRSDTAGRYELPPMPAGPVRVFVRAVGYRDDSTDVTLRDRTVVNLELRMAFEEIAVVRRAPPPQTSVITLAAPGDTVNRLAEFQIRKRGGVGKFLERGDIAKWDGRLTSDMIESMGAVRIDRTGLVAVAVNGRVQAPTCTICRAVVSDTLDPAVAAPPPARQACFMDIYVDGISSFQFGAEPADPPFDLNSIGTDAIEAVEVYAEASQVPSRYANRAGARCGAIIFWMRPKS
jgi:hypothetical protein